MTQPWNSPQSSAGTDIDWSTYTNAQQRWWVEWMDAGRLWLSWWYSTLPPMPWPQAGQVLPPAASEGNSAPESKLAHPPFDAGMPPPKVVTPRARTQSARHH